MKSWINIRRKKKCFEIRVKLCVEIAIALACNMIEINDEEICTQT